MLVLDTEYSLREIAEVPCHILSLLLLHMRAYFYPLLESLLLCESKAEHQNYLNFE